MIRMAAPIPTIRIKLGCFSLLEVSSDAGVEGMRGGASTGVAIRGAVHQIKNY